MSNVERFSMWLMGVVASIAGGFAVVEQASKYFWGHRPYAHHVTNSGSAIWAGVAILLIVFGVAAVTVSAIGVTVSSGNPSPAPPPKKRK